MYDPNTDWEKYLVKEYSHLKLYLHVNQNLIGRMHLWSKDPNAKDFVLHTTQEARDEFFDISKKAYEVLRELFDVNTMNYSSLGNVTSHLHVHLVPRYDHPIKFKGRVFEDIRYGKNAIPYDKREISEDIVFEIRDALKEKLDYEMEQN